MVIQVALPRILVPVGSAFYGVHGGTDMKHDLQGFGDQEKELARALAVELGPCSWFWRGADSIRLAAYELMLRESRRYEATAA